MSFSKPNVSAATLTKTRVAVAQQGGKANARGAIIRLFPERDPSNQITAEGNEES